MDETHRLGVCVPYGVLKARLDAKGSASGRLGERDCKQQENAPPLAGTAFPGFPGLSALSSCGSPWTFISLSLPPTPARPPFTSPTSESGAPMPEQTMGTMR